MPAFQKKLELGTYAFPNPKTHLPSKKGTNVLIRGDVAPPFYTRDGAIFHLYGRPVRNAANLYRYFFLRALCAAMPAITETPAMA